MPVSLQRLISVFLFTLVTVNATVTEGGSVRETPLVRAVRDCRRAIVNIHTEKSEPVERSSRFLPPKTRKVTGMGTGIVIDERGYIVTNCHVIHDVEQIIVTEENGETYNAQVVDEDPVHDLAVIKIDPVRPMSVMNIGTSSDVMLAEQVFAVGNAFGYEHTVTAGIVSAVSRDVEVDETQSYENLIQTDASINPGNSGGPLLNLDGQVIGINVAIRAGAQRIGFAIPIDDARKIIARLMSTQRRTGLMHGLTGRDVNSPEDQHLMVDSVVPGSPAERCGLQPGDIIRNVNGRPVSDQVDWERFLLDATPEEPVSILVDRNGTQLSLKLALVPATSPASPGRRQELHMASRSSPEKESLSGSGTDRAWQLFGIRLSSLSTSERADLPPRYNGGMKVLFVRSGSRAARNGIRNGDILVGLDGYETLGDRSLQFVLSEHRLRSMSAISFQIVRNRTQALMGSISLRTPAPATARRSRSVSH